METPQAGPRPWLLAAVLVLVTVLTYTIDPGRGGFGGALASDFAFDDIHLIIQNERLEEAGGAWMGFTGDYYTTGAVGASGEVRALGYYRPLAVLSTWLDYQAWERRAFGYHLTNLILHVGVVLLLFAFVRRITDHTWIPFATALLFAVHPAHTESVTFVSGRVDVLAALFSVASLLPLVRSWSSKGGASAVVAYLLFFCALLSKEMAITFPAAVFLLALTRHPAPGPATALKQTAPFIGVAVIYLVIRSAALGGFSPGSHSPTEDVALLSRVSVTLWEYVKLLIWPPFAFNVEPPIAYPAGASAAVVVRTALLLGLAALVLFQLKRGHTLVAFGLGWALVALLPVSHILPVETAIGERYLYIPSIGMMLAVAALLTALGRRFGGTALLLLLAGGLSVAYAANTIHRNQFWKDNLTFWAAKGELDGGSAESLTALGIELALEGRVPEAADAYRRALEIDPNHLEALNNYALLLLDLGQVEEAHRHAVRAIAISPTYADGLNTLATAFHAMGRFGEAVGQYKRAVRAKPDMRVAWVNLGNTYLAAGVPDSARRAYKRAVELEPDRQLAIQVARCYAMLGDVPNGMKYLYDHGGVPADTPEAYVLQGSLDLVSGNLNAGIASVLRATEEDPTYVEAWVELGQMMVAARRPDRARDAFTRALALDPNLSVAHNNLGALAEDRGQFDEALDHYVKASQLAPNDAMVLRNLGGALAQVGRRDEAQQTLNRSISIFPRDALAFFYRGRVHRDLGDLSAAVSDFRSATALNPTFAEAHLAVADLLYVKGDLFDALQGFKAFLRFAPQGHPRRAEAQEIVTELEG